MHFLSLKDVLDQLQDEKMCSSFKTIDSTLKAKKACSAALGRFTWNPIEVYSVRLTPRKVFLNCSLKGIRILLQLDSI